MFWHGVFTSSYQDIKHPSPIIGQHDTLRAGALGSYEALLRRMLEDPALLRYLNNDQNRKGKPNENLAREVMELFSLARGTTPRRTCRRPRGRCPAPRRRGGGFWTRPRNFCRGRRAGAHAAVMATPRTTRGPSNERRAV